MVSGAGKQHERDTNTDRFKTVAVSSAAFFAIALYTGISWHLFLRAVRTEPDNRSKALQASVPLQKHFQQMLSLTPDTNLNRDPDLASIAKDLFEFPPYQYFVLLDATGIVITASSRSDNPGLISGILPGSPLPVPASHRPSSGPLLTVDLPLKISEKACSLKVIFRDDLFFSEACFRWRVHGIMSLVFLGVWTAFSAVVMLKKIPFARYTRIAALIILVMGAGGLIWSAPGWVRPKGFDDRSAVSNAQVLLDRELDCSILFFRSRRRPAFLFFLLPVCSLFPNELSTTEMNAADNFTHRFFWYSRGGSFMFKEVSLYIFTFTILSFAVLHLVFTFFCCHEGLPYLMTALSLFFYLRIADNILTFSFTLGVHILVLAAFLYFMQKPGSPARFLAAALMLSAGILTKLDVAVAVCGILALGAYRVLHSENRKKEALRLGLYFLAAAVLPLLWYNIVLDGAMEETKRFIYQHCQYTLELRQYRPTSLAHVVELIYAGYTVLFPLSIAGMVLAVVSVGAQEVSVGAQKVSVGAQEVSVGERRRGREALVFFAGIFAGQSLVMVLPYLFLRFFIYYSLPVSYFTGTLLACLLPVGGGSASNDGGDGDSVL